MKILCSNCGFEGNINDNLIPEGGKDVTCPKCKNKFHVEKYKPEPPMLEQAEPDDLKEIEGGLDSSISQEYHYQKKYEYKIEFIKESFLFGAHQLNKSEKLLNSYADKGWELDKVAMGVSGGLLFKREAMILIFRRPRRATDK